MDTRPKVNEYGVLSTAPSVLQLPDPSNVDTTSRPSNDSCLTVPDLYANRVSAESLQGIRGITDLHLFRRVQELRGGDDLLNLWRTFDDANPPENRCLQTYRHDDKKTVSGGASADNGAVTLEAGVISGYWQPRESLLAYSDGPGTTIGSDDIVLMSVTSPAIDIDVGAGEQPDALAHLQRIHLHLRKPFKTRQDESRYYMRAAEHGPKKCLSVPASVGTYAAGHKIPITTYHMFGTNQIFPLGLIEFGRAEDATHVMLHNDISAEWDASSTPITVICRDLDTCIEKFKGFEPDSLKSLESMHVMACETTWIQDVKRPFLEDLESGGGFNFVLGKETSQRLSELFSTVSDLRRRHFRKTGRREGFPTISLHVYPFIGVLPHDMKIDGDMRLCQASDQWAEVIESAIQTALDKTDSLEGVPDGPRRDYIKASLGGPLSPSSPELAMYSYMFED